MLLRVAVFFLALLLSSAAQAAKRVALIIGNSSYRSAGELTNPRNDATDMVAALERHGFAVVLGLDLTKAGLDQKIRDFENALRGAEVGLFFYAGHGLQVSGQNYIVPTDAQLLTPAALDLELIRLELVQRIMESENRTNILFLDACRNNPLARNLAQAMGTRSTAIGRGLAPTEAGYGTLVSYSTQPGNVALDGTGGARNSPFAAALVKHLSSSNEDLSRILIAVRREVFQATEGKQVPWEHSALMGPFYFKAGANPVPPPYNIPNPVPAPATPQTSASDAERSRVVFNQGIAAHQRGDFDRAIADFSEAIRLNPSDVGAIFSRGNAYHQKKDFDRAITDYNEAIRLNPNLAIAFNNRGNSHKEKKDFDRAITDYNEAIRLNPNLASAFNNRGNSYKGKKDFDRAIADYDEAIRLKPDNANAFFNRGSTYFDKRQFDRAIADYGEALRLNPNDALALYQRGLAKKHKGDRSSDADIARARQLDPSVGK